MEKKTWIKKQSFALRNRPSRDIGTNPVIAVNWTRAIVSSALIVTHRYPFFAPPSRRLRCFVYVVSGKGVVRACLSFLGS